MTRILGIGLLKFGVSFADISRNVMEKLEYIYTCRPTYGTFNCLLYVIFFILLSECESGLQSCLDRLLYLYCKNWNLSANVDKSNM